MKTDMIRSEKDKKKVIRSVIQALILLALLILIVTAFFPLQKYTEYNTNTVSGQDNGFIAISYFGMDYNGSETLISRNRLDEHFKALKDSGYVTITQQDVLDYFNNGKQLPEKALFLIFEDGRRDTAVLSQGLLEKYNFKASMLAYANNLDTKNAQFLSASDLLEMKKSSYWELGVNGYRLSYINIFDRHDNYLGEMTPEDYSKVVQYIKREYNHYLMDFIRDKNDIPMESFGQMQTRIANDYQLMQTIFDNRADGLPGLYTIMHSNTDQFATNDKVSIENEKCINSYFKMNFNREMYCLNNKSCSIYDLTRMQPQAYWSRNHLMMRIWGDTMQNMAFIEGDAAKASKWTQVCGAAEHREDEIYLTSLPEGAGVIRLNDSDKFSDITLSAYLNGNKLGTQSVDLRANIDLKQYIAVEIKNNILFIYEQYPDGTKKDLFECDLDLHDGIKYQTWEENRQEAMGVEIKAKLEQTYQEEESKRIAGELETDKENTAKANNDPYVPGIDIKDKGSRYVEISLKGDSLTVSIDNKTAVKDLKVSILDSGYICLRSAWGEYGYSQRNLADDVYDGVFKSIVIKENTGADTSKGKIIFDNNMQGLEQLTFSTKQLWDSILGWIMNIF